MINIFKYALMLFLLIPQKVFSEQEHDVYIKEFPDNNINYFFKNNKAEAWRLVYADLSRPPADPDGKNHCSGDEVAHDEALSFDVSNIIKNTGDNFNIDNIHFYYDGESGKKALSLLLNDPKIKNSFISLGEVLINKQESKFSVLTEDRLYKPLTLLNYNKENKMYVCFGYLQHLILTPITQVIEEYIGLSDKIANTNTAIDPRKIVFWYDGAKAAPINSLPITQTRASSSKVTKKAHKTP